MKTETYTCQHCSTKCTRPTTRGNKPKWCGPKCATEGRAARTGRCVGCGAMRGLTNGYCSVRCSATPIRLAVEASDPEALRSALRDASSAHGECWKWTGDLDDGYPSRRIGGVRLHRAIVETSQGKPLGSQAVHHTCSNRACVNPDHLEPVTHSSNTAEMLARTAYLSRIRELEQALSELDPGHRLLSLVPLA